MGEASVYKNIVRTGWVSSVNAADRTARVTFKDMGTTFVSGPLKVIKNPQKTLCRKHKRNQAEAATRPLRRTRTRSQSARGYRRRVTMCFAFISRRTTVTGS